LTIFWLELQFACDLEYDQLHIRQFIIDVNAPCTKISGWDTGVEQQSQKQFSFPNLASA
jgi:hypothetical protein